MCLTISCIGPVARQPAETQEVTGHISHITATYKAQEMVRSSHKTVAKKVKRWSKYRWTQTRTHEEGFLLPDFDISFSEIWGRMSNRVDLKGIFSCSVDTKKMSFNNFQREHVFWCSCQCKKPVTVCGLGGVTDTCSADAGFLKAD